MIAGELGARGYKLVKFCGQIFADTSPIVVKIEHHTLEFSLVIVLMNCRIASASVTVNV